MKSNAYGRVRKGTRKGSLGFLSRPTYRALDGEITNVINATNRKNHAIKIVEYVFIAHSFDFRFSNHVTINKMVRLLNRSVQPMSENPPPRKETSAVA